jgi:ATP-binding cassette subfamily B protein
MDCGPTCLRMIAKYYGKHYPLKTLREFSYLTRNGVSFKGISEAAEKVGFKTLGARLTFEQLDEDVTLPCILYWNRNHFVVLPPQDYDRNDTSKKLSIVDPSIGLVKIDKQQFLKSWSVQNGNYGFALLLEPTNNFYSLEGETEKSPSLSFLVRYLRPYKRLLIQLIAGMLMGSILTLIIPFLTQSLVDVGINQHNLKFIYLVFIAQLVLFFGNTAIEVLRGWIILHISARINISIVSDFLVKLMRLPIRFFDTKMVGDITQRISDHTRIELFLTGTSLNTLFSLISMVVFLTVLAIYSVPIFLIFLVGSLISLAWIIVFLKKRRDLDYARFQNLSENQNSLYEIITGMQDIKMNNSEIQHRWDWERLQMKLFKINISNLSLSQSQNVGFNLLTQLKNILISFVAAKETLSGNISLGMMLSVSYIIGQLNSPISQILSFIQNFQDAKISMERLNEIHDQKEEEEVSDEYISPDSDIEAKMDLHLKGLAFQYGGPGSPLILDDLTFTIPFGKTTAIVGESGSGKSTLMKILLKFYQPTQGELLLGDIPVDKLSHKWWRNQCSTVMAEGFIFSNTISQNITVKENFDEERLWAAIRGANLEEFVDSLPLGISTKIGATGNGISSGQKQRILIARAIYRNPNFLFLDEATSALDSNNEREIIDNLERFSQGRTVLVIAHRLSTVKKAEQIIVLRKGRLIEQGTHATLIEKQGAYYELVKNQLELAT